MQLVHQKENLCVIKSIAKPEGLQSDAFTASGKPRERAAAFAAAHGCVEHFGQGHCPDGSDKAPMSEPLRSVFIPAWS